MMNRWKIPGRSASRCAVFFCLLFCTLPCVAAVEAAAPIIVPAAPQLGARSYLVMDYQSGQVLVEHNIDERMEPASLTKIMTEFVVAKELKSGRIKQDDLVTVSEKAWRMGGSKMFIEVNKKVSVGDLLKGMVIQSGNDASVALAEYVAGSEQVFAGLMNAEARRLGMKGTHFVNSTGWPDPQHYTTAHDMALLAAALIREQPEIYQLDSQREFTWNGIRQENRNELLGRDPGVDGIKTGHTDSAGYCLVASALRDGMRVISVVMGTDSPKARTHDSEALLNFAFRFYETRKLFNGNQAITSSRVWKGAVDNVDLGIRKDLYVTVPRGAFDRLVKDSQVTQRIMAPVSKGMIMGMLKVSLQGQEIASRPLVALSPVGQGSFFSRLADDVQLFFK